MAGRGMLSYFTRHATVANLLLLVLVIAGLTTLPQMRAQFFPDVVVDNVRVDVAWPGAGPEDVDTGVVQPLDSVLLAVEGVESGTSTAREGRASIKLEFEPGWDMARAAADVESAVEGVTTLPEDAETPEVRRGVWRDRVTDVVVTGPLGPAQLGRIADEFIARLFREGITRTTIRGLAAPQTTVVVPSAQLVAHNLSMAAIAAAITAGAETRPAGDVTGNATRVRTGTARRSPDEIAALPLGTGADGTLLTVGDVARIEVEGAARLRSYFVSENPAMSIRVDRSASGDAIGMQQTVEEVAAEMQASLPAGTEIQLIRTRSEYISSRLALLIDNGLMGLGLVVVLLFLFLNARTAFWVAAGIPVAMLTALALMHFAGLTLNMISLFALIITLGIVVDDAIVVGEHADALARRGAPPIEAAERAAQRMALPVISATLTTVIAFFGLTAISGRFGDLIADIPFTVIAVLLASLVECFLILPSHMAHALRHSAKEHWYDAPSRLVNRGFVALRDGPFRWLMAGVVRARYVVLAAAVLALASQLAQIIDGRVQWRFFNPPAQTSVTGNFMMTEGASRADSLAMMREMQRATEAVAADYEARYGTNPVVFAMGEVGGSAGRGLAGSDTKDADLLGSMSIELIEADLRPYSSFQFVADLQDAVVQHSLAEVVSFRGWRSGPGGDALDIQFTGADAPTLKAAAEDLKAALARIPEASAVEDSLAYDKDELSLTLTRRGQALGFQPEVLGRVLRHRLSGIEAATYADGPRSATIRVELPKGELTADFIETMLLRAPSGQYVPLSDIVEVERTAGFSTIRRENGLRVVSVTGDLDMDDAARASEITRQLSEDILPAIASERQVNWALSGLSEQENTFLADALLALMLVLTGIYLVLSWIFASWTRPLVVMAVIPFGLVGAIWGHALWGVPLSMFSVVGLLGMTGIIINDSIVLVTTIDENAAQRGLMPAIIDGTADRLRPVMLTTLTTVLGLAPLLYETSSQAEFLKPTVITLTYGLGFGMVLVLLVVPALMAAQRDIARAIHAFRRALRSPARGQIAGTLALAALNAGWLAVTLGWVAVTGALPAPLAAEGSVWARAALLYGAGVLALALLGWLIGALVLRAQPGNSPRST